MHRKGFTLIELLVVIAIIAILCAIMFPIFKGSHDSAHFLEQVNNQTVLTISGTQMDKNGFHVFFTKTPEDPDPAEFVFPALLDWHHGDTVTIVRDRSDKSAQIWPHGWNGYNLVLAHTLPNPTPDNHNVFRVTSVAVGDPKIDVQSVIIQAYRLSDRAKLQLTVTTTDFQFREYVKLHPYQQFWLEPLANTRSPRSMTVEKAPTDTDPNTSRLCVTP